MVSYAHERVSAFFVHEQKRCDAVREGPVDLRVLKEYANTLREVQEKERRAFVANLKTFYLHTRRSVAPTDLDDLVLVNWYWFQLYHR